MKIFALALSVLVAHLASAGTITLKSPGVYNVKLELSTLFSDYDGCNSGSLAVDHYYVHENLIQIIPEETWTEAHCEEVIDRPAPATIRSLTVNLVVDIESNPVTIEFPFELVKMEVEQE